MSFEYSLPFIIEVLVLANLPGFAIFLLISCFAAASRPLRFRSRYIAVALCASPQLIYWILFGGARNVEPIEMGFSYVPWFCAWLDSLIIAGFVIGIGHFTRYKPGLIWIFTTLTLIIAVVVFEVAIGFDELDYQLYIVKNNPELITGFRDHSITETLDDTINDPAVKKYLRDFYYPTEPQARRQELIREIQIRLSYDRWPAWFKLPEELDYESEKERLFAKYELFIAKRPNSRRMPIALYFKAILNEYSPDIRILGNKEVLHFYSDYPQERSTETWLRLYRDFGDSPESLEARWRIAKHWAGRGIFEPAEELLIEAQSKVTERLKVLEVEQKPNESIFNLFKIPPESVMTAIKLKELQRRIELTLSLIGKENRPDNSQENEKLSQFVMLNPHALDYPQQIYVLLKQTEPNEPLYDNILFAEAKLIEDEEARILRLNEIQSKYFGTDGGMQALYELGLQEISQWRQQDDSDLELKKQYLEEARKTLTYFINSYPESFYLEQAKKHLDEISAD